MIVSRSSPRSAKYARMSMRPVSSPCDPAAGCSVTAGRPATSARIPCRLPHELERSLGALVLLVRVEVAESGQPPDPLVDARVVLHRAGAERVEAGVDAERAVRERRDVANELRLGELGQARGACAAELGRQLGLRQAVVRHASRAPPRSGALEDQRRVRPSPTRLGHHEHLLESPCEPIDVVGRPLLGHRDEEHVVHPLVVAAEHVAGVHSALAHTAHDLTRGHRACGTRPP